MKRLFSKKKKNTKIWGLDLAEAVKLNSEDGVPIPLVRCVHYIEQTGLDVEGLYRIPGSLRRVMDMQKAFDAGDDPNLHEFGVHAACGSLKSFLASLPEPVTTFSMYDSFLQAQSTQNKVEKLKAVRDVVHALPECNRRTLEFIIQHLKRVSSMSAENKMSVPNLAIIFYPTLFRSSDDSPSKILTDSGILSGLVQVLINEQEKVFGNEPIVPTADDSPLTGTPMATSPAAPQSQEGKSPSKIDSLDSQYEGSPKTLSGHTSGRPGSERTSPSSPRNELNISTAGSVSSINNSIYESISSAITPDINPCASFQLLSLEERERQEQQAKATRARVYDSFGPLAPAVQSYGDGNREERSSPHQQRNNEIDGEEAEEDTRSSYNATRASDVHKLQQQLLSLRIDLRNPLPVVSKIVELKRQIEGRTADVSAMSLNELADEKKLVKKELRNFDIKFFEAFGKQPSKDDKEPLREMYHRYKQLKVLLDKAQSSHNANQARHRDVTSNNKNVDFDSKTSEQSKPQTQQRLQPTGHTSASSQIETQTPANTLSAAALITTADINHEELRQEVTNVLMRDAAYLEAKRQKRDIQKKLHQYQNEFFERHGRKVTHRIDRQPMEADYELYKQLKARLSEMEANTEAFLIQQKRDAKAKEVNALLA